MFAATLAALWVPHVRAQQLAAAQTVLPEVTIKEAPNTAQKYQIPATTESVTRGQIDETINVMNTEDALKYMPSLIVRKRNFGDQYAPHIRPWSERAQLDLRRRFSAVDADRQQ